MKTYRHYDAAGHRTGTTYRGSGGCAWAVLAALLLMIVYIPVALIPGTRHANGSPFTPLGWALEAIWTVGLIAGTVWLMLKRARRQPKSYGSPRSHPAGRHVLRSPAVARPGC
jgi:hypothetical protein